MRDYYYYGICNKWYNFWVFKSWSTKSNSQIIFVIEIVDWWYVNWKFKRLNSAKFQSDHNLKLLYSLFDIF